MWIRSKGSKDSGSGSCVTTATGSAWALAEIRLAKCLIALKAVEILACAVGDESIRRIPAGNSFEPATLATESAPEAPLIENQLD